MSRIFEKPEERIEAISYFYKSTIHANRCIDLEIEGIESKRGLGLALTEQEKREYRVRRLGQLLAESPYNLLWWYLR